MLMLMLTIEIPWATNTQRSTPNVQRPIEEDQKSEATDY
jgi:hypothetical protein